MARLKADAGVTALIGQRVYDQPPASPTFPYLTLGEDQIIPDRADCYEGDEVTLTLHVWSRAVGFPEAKRITVAVRAALKDAPLVLAGHRLIDFVFGDARSFRDEDPLTTHSILTFRALTEPV